MHKPLPQASTGATCLSALLHIMLESFAKRAGHLPFLPNQLDLGTVQLQVKLVRKRCTELLGLQLVVVFTAG